MGAAHVVGAFVAHAGTDAYGPGKVIGMDGEHRRVRFVYFVATIRATDLRTASDLETALVREWLQQKEARYGGRW
ncbi:hypothetical protein [Streptomyces xantholiticus]|uniref:hypothetical protein n=1 Tax=Streptomyces xantholiticus TaxID=68285 RepID=UPI00167B4D11|nr:hypothetical protein [Streptomyces xantholiticus]GGW48018.1 hypothetical protein GCM10010381_36510 [Streptomyces xantholiticus]